jgi:subtilisin family serine protease
MKRPIPGWSAWIRGLILAASLVGGCADLSKDDRGLDQPAAAAVDLLGKHEELKGQTLSVVAATSARYVHSGRQVYAFKVSDSRGDIHSIALDDQYRVVDEGAIAADERSARWRSLGAFDTAVAERIKTAGSEPIAVFLWLTDTTEPSRERPSPRGEGLAPAHVDEVYAAADRRRAAAVERLVTPVLDRVRAYDGDAHADSSSPVIAARLDAEALHKLARDPAIDRIYLNLPAQPELAIAKAASGITQLNQSGTLGSGVRVAAINAGGGLVETASLLLRPVVQDSLNVCPGQVDPHATSVAGALLERRITLFGQTVGEQGAAPAVTLRAAGSCATVSDELMAASTRAANWGARAINLSWGLDTQLALGATDRFYDDMTFNRWRTVVKSAGNRNCLPPPPPPNDGNVTSPGLAYNVITVGGYDDHRTPGWGDDTVDACASFRNPQSRHGDREKPELAAPSVDVEVVTAGHADLARVTGTSIAAPLVTASVALLIERNGRLAVWPEIMRAILMATATHNIEGSRRLSDIDGAGGLVTSAAAGLLSDPQRWNGLHYACDNSTPATLALATLAVGPGTRHRVVLSWDTDPAYNDYSSQPSADIDLHVVDANGRTVASSLSFDNTFEIVDFDSWQAGTYTVQARKFRCDKATWLGWAWHTLPMRNP